MKKALWQDSQARFMDRVVRAHDSELYAERASEGYIVIYRRARRLGRKYELQGFSIQTYEDSPQFVFALTDNWTTTGRPREWGSEVVLDRLKQHDVWNHEKFFAELEQREQTQQKRKERDIQNKNEAWLSDNYKRFKEAFKDIRVANMDMSDRRRRQRELSQELKN